MVGGLKTLLVVEGQYHSILLRERQAFKELGERGSIGRDRNGSDNEAPRRKRRGILSEKSELFRLV